MSTAQEQFDEEYITSSEIYKRLGVTRPALHFRRRSGQLPGAIHVFGQQLIIWRRREIQPHLDKWDEALRAKRGVLE